MIESAYDSMLQSQLVNMFADRYRLEMKKAGAPDSELAIPKDGEVLLDILADEAVRYLRSQMFEGLVDVANLHKPNVPEANTSYKGRRSCTHCKMVSATGMPEEVEWPCVTAQLARSALQGQVRD